MQHVYYIDNHFIKENSLQYYLSIRYATDGLSFCIHDSINNRLLAFSYQPFYLDSQEAVIAKTKQIITEDQLLSLRYQKVFLLPCNKDKILIPNSLSQELLAQHYKICLPLHKNETLYYKEVKAIESYLVEAIPNHFIDFLQSHYSTISVVNHAYPFIKQSLANIGFNTYHLFINIHHQYFDLLITKHTDILLFNSFCHHSINDIVYYVLNCIEQCQVDHKDLKTLCSGDFIHEPTATELLSKYIPQFSILPYTSPLHDLIPNHKGNDSSFIHLLNIHQCE
jgi:hypothetical protein